MDRVRNVEIREAGAKAGGGIRESANETSEMVRSLNRDWARDTSQESI